MTDIIKAHAIVFDGDVVAVFEDEDVAWGRRREAAYELECQVNDLEVNPIDAVLVEGNRLVPATSQAAQEALNNG